MAVVEEQQAVVPVQGVRDALDVVHRGLDELIVSVASLNDAPRPVTGADLREFIAELDRAVNRLESARLRVGTVARGERLAGRSPHLDEGQFFRRGGRADGRQAAVDGSLSEALGNASPKGALDPPGSCSASGEDTAPRAREGQSPASRTRTGRALDKGVISKAHVAVIVRELARLPERLGAAERAEVERRLVASASRRSPASFRRDAPRCLAAVVDDLDEVDTHEETAVAAEEERAWASARFWVRHDEDGTSTGQFVVPTVQARMLEKVIGAMVSPTRRSRPRAGGAATSREPVSGTGRTSGPETWEELDWQAERGRAFAELLERMPHEHLGSKVAATIVVHTDLETLRGEVRRVARTDVGTTLSAGQVRRLASEAGIIPSVLGGASLPLDLGTQKRFFSTTQRLALSAVYTECAAAGCDRPFSWCQIHHEQPWSPRHASRDSGLAGGAVGGGGVGPPGRAMPGGDDDTPDETSDRGVRHGEQVLRGPTNLANAIPLCGAHHRALDKPGVHHTVKRDAHGRATVHFEGTA
ncbi:DUF222 domain-containing protein [Kytococcus sp. Marseille-QA3725]